MYGTIARLSVKPNISSQQLIEAACACEQRHIPGFGGHCVYQAASDPLTYFLVVVFENEAAYRANAASQAQHQDYLQLLTVLNAEPEWLDGQIIHWYEQQGE